MNEKVKILHDTNTKLYGGQEVGYTDYINDAETIPYEDVGPTQRASAFADTPKPPSASLGNLLGELALAIAKSLITGFLEQMQEKQVKRARMAHIKSKVADAYREPASKRQPPSSPATKRSGPSVTGRRTVIHQTIVINQES